MRRLFLAACGLLALGMSWALAQGVTQTLSGTEAWQVGIGPAGPGFYTNAEAMRGAQTYGYIGTGTTQTTTISPNITEVIVTGPITTLNLSLPQFPFDQQTIRIACPGGTVTTLTLSGFSNGGSNIVGPTFNTCSSTVATSLDAVFTFVASQSTWYRVH